MATSYRLALLCGLLPLIAGLSVFVAWLSLRSRWLMDAGYEIIIGGTVLFFVGLICLACYYSLAAKSGPEFYGNFRRKTAVAFCLLLSNFPVALGIVISVAAIETSYRVTVVNERAEPVEAFVVFGGGVSEDFGTLPPCMRLTRVFWIGHDGVLTCTGIHEGNKFEAVVDGYVTGSIGGNTLVQLMPGGRVNVSRVDR